MRSPADERPRGPRYIAVAGNIGSGKSSLVRWLCQQFGNLDDMTDADYECLLNLPEMQEVIDNSAEGKGERLTPSCDEAGLGEAFPPRRIVDTIRQIGDRGAAAGVRSICEADFRPAMQGILEALQPRVGN